MVKNTIAQVGIPNLSPYLELMNNSNKAITDSFINLGAVGDSYNQIQSDKYNNPLIDRLKRASSQQEADSIISSVDSNMANPALRDAITGRIQETNKLNDKIKELQLTNQYDSNDPNIVALLTNALANTTDPTTRVSLQTQLNAATNNRRTFDQTMKNYQFGDKVLTDISDGQPEMTYIDAQNSEQLNLINAAKTKLITDNQTRALANIGVTPSILGSGSSSIQNTNSNTNTGLNINSKFDPSNPLPDFYDNNLLNKESGNYTNTGSIGNGRQITSAAAQDVGYNIKDINNNPALEKEASAKYNVLLANAYKSKTGDYPTYRELNLLWNQGPGGGVDLLTADPNALAIDVLTKSYGGNKAKAEQALEGNLGSITDTVATYQTKLDNYYNGDLLNQPTSKSKVVGDTTTTGTPKLIQAITQNAQRQVQEKYNPIFTQLNSLPVSEQTIAETKKQTIESRNFERQALAEQIFKVAVTPEQQNRVLAQMGITEPEELSTIGKYLKEYNSSNLTPRTVPETAPEIKTILDQTNADFTAANKQLGLSNKTIADSDIYQNTVNTFKNKSLDDIVSTSFEKDTNSKINSEDKVDAVKYIGENIETLRTKLKEVDPRLSDKTDAELAAALKVSATYDNGGWFGSEKFAPDIDRAVSFIQNNGTFDSKAIVLKKQEYTDAKQGLTKIQNAIQQIALDQQIKQQNGQPFDEEARQLTAKQKELKTYIRTNPILQQSLNVKEQGVSKTPKNELNLSIIENNIRDTQEQQQIDTQKFNEIDEDFVTEVLNNNRTEQNIINRSYKNGKLQSKILSFAEFKKTNNITIPNNKISYKKVENPLGSEYPKLNAAVIKNRSLTDKELKSVYKYLINKVSK